MEEDNNIKIPIKAIVEQAMTSNGAKYDEDEFNYLRKYFIACLNLGYLEPKDLVNMVNKFASKIKYITLQYNNVNRLDYYIINNGVLYISGMLKESNQSFYEINLYKAITEVIFNSSDVHIGFNNAICNMVAEKIQNMDINDSRIIIPKTINENIGDKVIQVRCGYYNYNLIISLLKQLIISKGLNENVVIKRMYFEDFDAVINDLFNDESSKLLLQVLDNITILYISRVTKHTINESEFSLLEKYQIILNDNFTKVDQNYLAFCALVTTDELRKKIMNKFGE